MILIRVELRGVEPTDARSREVSEQLNLAGFSRTVSRLDGTRFKLPAAEFRFAGDASVGLESARDLAAAAIRPIHEDFGVLAMQVEEWTSLGLKVKVP